jgi:hypothetical protein
MNTLKTWGTFEKIPYEFWIVQWFEVTMNN